jgi:hypothetical protein
MIMAAQQHPWPGSDRSRIGYPGRIGKSEGK